MKRVRWVVIVSLLAASMVLAQGQGGGNPFQDRADNGETVHVLPSPAAAHSPRDTQPTDAPLSGQLSVFPASFGSGSLIDHGGPEISGAAFQAIFWNSSVANSTATSNGYTTLQNEIAAFASSFSGSSDYSIIQQYGSTSPISASFAVPPAVVDSQPRVSKLSDSSIQSYLTGLFNAGKLVPNASTIYGIYFPAGTRVCLQGGCSCSSFCGYHSAFVYGSGIVKYAVFPYPNCAGCSLPGKAVADMLTIVSSHEIREAVTDPQSSAWYDSVGYEADDKCAWHHLYQMTTGSFWVQPEYSNANGGCVVP